jgi:hypothetical protein
MKKIERIICFIEYVIAEYKCNPLIRDRFSVASLWKLSDSLVDIRRGNRIRWGKR